MTNIMIYPTLAGLGGGYDGTHMNWDGWMWIPGLVFMVVIAVAAVAVVVVLARKGPPDGSTRARDILAERYARGELTTDEYHERLDGLGR